MMINENITETNTKFFSKLIFSLLRTWTPLVTAFELILCDRTFNQEI